MEDQEIRLTGEDEEVVQDTASDESNHSEEEKIEEDVCGLQQVRDDTTIMRRAEQRLGSFVPNMEEDEMLTHEEPSEE